MTNALRAAGFDICFVELEDETRRNITLLDESYNQYTKINEPGPGVAAHHLAALGDKIDQMARPGDLWAFCGSLPPGSPSGLYASLIQQVQEHGARALLDSSGLAFREGVAAHPFAIKPNSEEASELLGNALRSDEEHCTAAHRLQAEGVPVVALTRGAQGLVLAMEGQILMAYPPAVRARSPVGAGDAALAGLLWAISDGCNAVETARRVVACGTATAMEEGTGVGERALVEELLGQVRVFRQTTETCPKS
jgi:1-phosphofructokinase family hexose kinase